MNIEVTRINQCIEEDPAGYVKNVNEDYLFRLNRIVDEIEKVSAEKSVILLSGPSGSGKTTTAMMIEHLLDERGHETHMISMDDYFCPLTEHEKYLLTQGTIDLESPDRIDKPLLNEQIKALAQGEEIEIPKYDFTTSSRVSSGRKLSIKKGEIVIFEGIHALNPDVITVPDRFLMKIYVSVRTRVTCDDIVLHPSKVRLLRRMIRDKNFRKRSLRETLNMFENVEIGENKYIMPYKHRADFDVDTFIAYEMSAYRDTLLDELHKMSDAPQLADVTRVLENLAPLGRENIPSDSLICEFIGK